MIELLDTYEPQPKQALAHASPARFILYGGGMYGGKTYWIAQEVYSLMLEYPGIEGVLGRFNHVDTIDQTQIYEVFQKILPGGAEPGAGSLVAEHKRASPQWIRFKNGSRVGFVGFKDFKASAEYGFVGIDQAEEVPWETITLLNTRLRQMLPDGTFPHFRMLLTCNPTGGMLKTIFLDREDPNTGKTYSPEDYAFVPALYSDNKFADPNYIDEQRKTLSEDDFRRYMEGNWDVFRGQAITEFDRKIHVIEPFDTWWDERWRVYRGIDHGTSSPTVCLWGTVSPEGDIFITQEYVGVGRSVGENARAIAALSVGMNLRGGHSGRGTWIDPRAHQVKTRLGEDAQFDLIQEYGNAGVYAQRARSTRVAGLAAIKSALKLDASRRHPVTLATPAPQLYIVRTCKRLIWELPRLQYAEATHGWVDDVAKVEDHAFDALRFLLMGILAVRRVSSRHRGNYVSTAVGI